MTMHIKAAPTEKGLEKMLFARNMMHPRQDGCTMLGINS
jgi:hypothetical protein